MVRFVEVVRPVRCLKVCKGVWRYVKVCEGKVGLQIKCLLELNCVSCSFKLSTCVRHSWVPVVKGTKIRMPSRGCYNGPDANSCGSGTKRERVSSGAPFYDGRHVTPRGCYCSVKQDHQFLTKISIEHMSIKKLANCHLNDFKFV